MVARGGLGGFLVLYSRSLWSHVVALVVFWLYTHGLNGRTWWPWLFSGCILTVFVLFMVALCGLGCFLVAVVSSGVAVVSIVIPVTINLKYQNQILQHVTTDKDNRNVGNSCSFTK